MLSVSTCGHAIRKRRWPFYLLFALGVLAGVALWAYSPTLPAEMLIARYANDQSKFIDVGGVRAHVRDQGNPDGIPLVLIHGSIGSLHMWEGWVRELGIEGAADLGRPAGPRPHRRLAARRVHDRGLCRFHRGAGRHAESRPLRAGRPFAGRRRGLDLRRDAARPGEPAHPGRCRGLSARRRRGALADAARAPAGGRRHRHLLQARAPGAALARRGLCRSGDGDARARQALRRAAALPRQPRGHPAARPHPGAARSDAAQAACTCRP